MEIKDIIAKYGINVMKGILPTPVAAILDAINDCKSEDELKAKFDQLKRYSEEYTKEFSKAITSLPVSVDIEYASVVVLYYLIEPSNINVFLDSKQLQKDIESILDDNLESIDEFEVYSDYIILKSPNPVRKNDWNNGAVKTMKEILDVEFNVKIRSILYA